MTSVVHRPATLIPDVFGWLEGGWPFATNAIRVEQYVDGILQVTMPAIGAAKAEPVTIKIGKGT